MPNQSYRRGVCYAVLAGVFLSVAGLIVRYIESADAWTVLFYRSWAFSLTVFVFMLFRDGKDAIRSYLALRPVDLVVASALAFGFIFYVLSLYSTSVATTVLLLSTGPFFAALLGRIVLGERVGIGTWITMLIAMAGVSVMVAGDTVLSDLLGMGYAVAAVASFAVLIVALRYSGPERDNMAATSLAGLVAALICLFFVDTFVISRWDLLMSILLGSVQVGVGFILITLATRSVPSAQVPLYTLGETALAPLWVWWFVSEVPTRNTLIGGALILFAVILKGLTGISHRSAVTKGN